MISPFRTRLDRNKSTVACVGCPAPILHLLEGSHRQAPCSFDAGKMPQSCRGGRKFGTPLKATMFSPVRKMKGRQPRWMSRIMQHHIKPVAEDLGIPLEIGTLYATA